MINTSPIFTKIVDTGIGEPVAEFYNPMGNYDCDGSLTHTMRLNLESLLTRMENIKKYPNFKPEMIEEEVKGLHELLKTMS